MGCGVETEATCGVTTGGTGTGVAGAGCFKSRLGTGGVPGAAAPFALALFALALFALAPDDADPLAPGLYPAKNDFHSSEIEFGSRRYCSYISSTSHSLAPKEPPNLFSGVIPATERKPICVGASRPTEDEVAGSGIDHKS